LPSLLEITNIFLLPQTIYIPMTVSDLVRYDIAPDIHIFAAEAGLALTFGYCCVDARAKTAVIIDAPQYCDEVFGSLCEREGYSVAAILLTHSHWDHTASAAAMKRRFDAPLHIHRADEYRLTEPNAHTVWALPFVIESVTAEFYLENRSILTFGGWNFEVRHTPGHTEGGVCFIEHERGLVLAGDTLFAQSIGRTDLPGGNFEELIASIRRELLPLPDETIVLPGHGDPTTIGEERLGNPFLTGG